MLNILIADDEEKIRELIKKYAVFEGHTVIQAEDGMKAVELCQKTCFDIIIMDVMMPELDGFSAVKEIRKTCDTPVLMLSARGEEYDRIHGFELGIDDYVVKPFSPRELMLRLDAIIKRTRKSENASGFEAPHEIYSLDDFEADFTARRVTVDGVSVSLSPKEYDLLFYMIRNKNIALSREKLISEVWGYDFYGDDRTLDTHIKLLRRSLKQYAPLITTLRGVGYRFEEKLESKGAEQ